MSDLTISSDLTIPAAEIVVSFARAGGPGGQNVNKVASKVELRWSPGESQVLTEADREWLLHRLEGRLTSSGELIVTSQRTRDQAKNRQDALAKLGDIVRSALTRPKPRKATRPSRAVHERRIQDKKHRADTKRRRRPPDE